MKPISAHVSETDYQELKSLAARSGRSVADLLREAMAEYLMRERRTGRSILDLPPHRSGRLLAGWTRSKLMDEMVER
jgi:hypothetical protein